MTLGVVGVGHIDLAAGLIGAALGMTLIPYGRYFPDAEKLAGLEVENVEFD